MNFLHALPSLLLFGLSAGCTAPATPTAPADFGALRGSTVALAADELPDELVYLSGSLDPDELEELRGIAPNLRILSGLDRTSALEHAAEAHGADAHLLTDAFLAAAPKLRWVQAWSAGVERYLDLEGLVAADSIVMTNARGASGPVIAEHAFAMLLQLTRGLDRYRTEQDAGRWSRGAAENATSLSGKTLLVAGLGGIGSEIARLGKGFGMTVLGTVRTARPAPEYVDELRTGEALDAWLEIADVVAIALPLTAETSGLFDAERLARMKPGAVLVNIARGRIVHTDALVEALESGALGGACLDVTDPEPLPEGHPLFALERVVLTPHVAGRAELSSERRWALLAENLRRFSVGEPLLNVVDKQAGY